MNDLQSTMDIDGAGSSLDLLISSFNSRITELQQLVIGRNMYAASSVTDLKAVDTAVKTMELQMQSIKNRLREEAEAVPRARKLVELSLRQQRKLQHMLSHLPSRLPASVGMANRTTDCLMQEDDDYNINYSKPEEEPIVLPKEKKGRGSAPRWYITAEELASLSSYMRGRLTVDKVNTAINDMAGYADANAQLIAAPKKKLAEDSWEKALELRDISMAEAVKNRHFFLEIDMKGSGLKLDNTGKAILTVLRHLGRIHEMRIGHNRVIILSKPQ